MWFPLWCVLAVLLILVIILYQAFLLLEERALFVPIQEHTWKPTRPYENIYFRGSSERPWLHGWYIPFSNEAPVVLFCHGNTGNISHRRYVVDLCYEMRLSLFLFDYRGYGYSEGSSNLDSLKTDGEEAYNYLLSKGYSPGKIIVWGESLGGITATHIASIYPCYRLLLLATFADLTSLADSFSGLMSKMAKPFLFFQEESNLRRLEKVTATPVLIVHSRDDEIIPYSHAEALYEAVPHQWKKFLTIQGGHGTPQLTPDLIEEMLRFCWQEPSVSAQCLDILDYIAKQDLKHGR